MTIDTIPNFIQVDDHTILGGQPTEQHFRSARAAGYEVVVNLAPTSAIEHSLPDEAELLAGLGFEYHHIPVAWSAPTVGDFDQFADLMNSMGDRPALIHCAGNFRVTAFYALYAITRFGWSDEQAEALMDRVWKSHPDISMDDNWKVLIAQVKQQLRATV